MFKVIVSLALFFAVCSGAPDGRVYCGPIPKIIFRCLHSPRVVSSQVSAKCGTSATECDYMTCVFRESNLLDGTAVNKQKVTSFFDEYAKDHPDWSPAVQHMKSECLGTDLKAQSVYLNCPAYDIMACAVSYFFRYASPSQWLTSDECAYARSYASACPLCPEDCFARQVPIGSCNACIRLPRAQTP